MRERDFVYRRGLVSDKHPQIRLVLDAGKDSAYWKARAIAEAKRRGVRLRRVIREWAVDEARSQ